MESLKGASLHGGGCNSGGSSSDEEIMNTAELRRGPWTVDEDLALANYIALHGEGRWNSLAHCAGLKRTGKSCRLRWLNYLRPDVRRGNLTLEEQLLILDLHSRWGNRWSKIAQFLPGRTDNEIKNYWRTRVQKHAKQLKCDVNSKQFKDTMRYLWMPRLVERIQAEAAAAATTSSSSSKEVPPTATASTQFHPEMGGVGADFLATHHQQPTPMMGSFSTSYITPDSSINTTSSPVSDFTAGGNYGNNCSQVGSHVVDSLSSPFGWDEFQAMDQWYGTGAGDTSDIFWNPEDIYVFQPQFSNSSSVYM